MFCFTRIQAIIITPTASGNLTVSSRLATLDDVILTRYQAYPLASQNDSIPIRAPDTGLTPAVALISGPSAVPSCGVVALHGFASGAVGYRSPLYHWAVATEDGETRSLSTLQTAAASQSPMSRTIQLDSSLFVLGVEYYVHLVITNSLNVVSRPARHLLRRTSLASPVSIRIQGAPEDTVAADESALFSAEITAASCASVTSSLTTWQLWRQGDSSIGELDQLVLSSAASSSNSFLVPSQQLVANQRYYVLASANVAYSAPAAGQVIISARRNVTATPGLLQVVIRGGQGSVSSSNGFTLTALTVQSRVAATAGAFSAPSYQWLCLDNAMDVVCQDSPHVGSLQLPSSPRLQIPGGVLAAGRLYTFTVQVASGSYSASASVQVHTEAATAPVIRVQSGIVPQPIASRKITLHAWVTSSQPNVTISWQSVSGLGKSNYK